MKARKLTTALMALALLGATAAVPLARGGREGSARAREAEPAAREVEVTGRVRLVGTGAFPSLVISGEDRDWHVYQAERDGLMGLQHRVVPVRAREYYRDLFFANGFPAGRWFFLRDVEVIAVD